MNQTPDMALRGVSTAPRRLATQRMSKHPGNPWWDHARDIPIQISTEAQWEEAEQQGFITVDHVLLRIEAMLRVAVGEPTDGAAAYDDDGFVRALVAAGWSGEGWRIQLHPNDHDPPHVHFWEKGDPAKQIRLALDSGAPLDGERLPRGLNPRKLEKAAGFIVAHNKMLMSRWQEARA